MQTLADHRICYTVHSWRQVHYASFSNVTIQKIMWNAKYKQLQQSSQLWETWAI